MIKTQKRSKPRQIYKKGVKVELDGVLYISHGTLLGQIIMTDEDTSSFGDAGPKWTEAGTPDIRLECSDWTDLGPTINQGSARRKVKIMDENNTVIRFTEQDIFEALVTVNVRQRLHLWEIQIKINC
jgi:hypothetical protein